jgi:adenylosuccinate synthase
MSATAPLSSVYKKALESYEQLNQQGKLKDEELALIKRNASISDVLQAIDEAKVKNESRRSTATTLIHKITPAYIEKLDRFSKIVETAIQSSKFYRVLIYIYHT